MLDKQRGGDSERAEFQVIGTEGTSDGYGGASGPFPRRAVEPQNFSQYWKRSPTRKSGAHILMMSQHELHTT
jgi:hypothetical protein